MLVLFKQDQGYNSLIMPIKNSLCNSFVVYIHAYMYAYSLKELHVPIDGYFAYSEYPIKMPQLEEDLGGWGSGNHYSLKKIAHYSSH